MSEQAGAPGSERGVSVLGLRYNFSDDFHIALVEQYGWDMFNTIYLESDQMFDLTDDLDLRIGAQFIDQRSTGEEILGDFDRAGEDSIRLGTSFDFSELGLDGLAADVTWVYGDTPDSGRSASPNQQEVNFTVDIRPPIDLLENFWLRGQRA